MTPGLPFLSPRRKQHVSPLALRNLLMAHFSPHARGNLARTQRHKQGEMNGMELEFHQMLELRRLAGEFTHVYFEQITLKLAPDLRYTPDFAVYDAQGLLSFYETKGFFRDDSRVKIKMAAEIFPMHSFYLARKVRGAWDYTEV
jgi:hypothetical protein